MDHDTRSTHHLRRRCACRIHRHRDAMTHRIAGSERRVRHACKPVVRGVATLRRRINTRRRRDQSSPLMSSRDHAISSHIALRKSHRRLDRIDALLKLERVAIFFVSRVARSSYTRTWNTANMVCGAFGPTAPVSWRVTPARLRAPYSKTRARAARPPAGALSSCCPAWRWRIRGPAGAGSRGLRRRGDSVSVSRHEFPR